MLIKCNKRGLPETYETIEFDANGICNICHQKEYRDTSIEWRQRKEMLDEIIPSLTLIREKSAWNP